MYHATVNQIVELSFLASAKYEDPFNQVAFQATITKPDASQITLPGFWAGEQCWKVRFSPDQCGEYSLETISSEGSLHERKEKVTASPYDGSNPLYLHGAIEAMPDQRHLQHVDGTPFFWLADTWWMSFTERIQFPEEFRELTVDRIAKNFNVVQIVAGLYPDMPWMDERGKNEAGFPWTEHFETINPAYFDMVDLRVAHLVAAGIVPCIVGSWGYFMDFAGMDVLKKHWNYLIARYSAYPVVWCAAGEGMMKYYLADSQMDPEEWKAMRQGEWSQLIAYMRELDGHQRMITIHPTNYGREQLSDPTLIDFEMLQTGHGGYTSLGPTVDMLEHSLNAEPKMPVLVSEVNYEGIGESAREEMQRFHFWTCVLSGAMGHTYGANGLWQVNGKEKPYGPSPHGTSWGDIPWQEAAALPGSKQLGLGKALLESYPWWELTLHPEWVSHPASEENRHQCYIAGIPEKLRIVYFPVNMSWVAWSERLQIIDLEENIQYHAFYFNPKTGKRHDLGTVQGHSFTVPKPPIFQDWVVVLSAE